MAVADTHITKAFGWLACLTAVWGGLIVLAERTWVAGGILAAVVVVLVFFWIVLRRLDGIAETVRQRSTSNALR